jgi:3-oxoacyl-[acyl-carrier-protein] synthase II
MAVAGFGNSMALSMKNDPHESSIPFDKRRDGFVLGEGAGVMVLEEYESAKKRGAKIYAEVTGYGNTCDAYHMTQPHPEALGGIQAIKLAYEQASIKKEDTLYINAHGTSTPLNDKTETLAIKKALGEEAAYLAYVSSTKSMTGHMLGAAALSKRSLPLCLFAPGDIPPTIGYKEPDPSATQSGRKYIEEGRPRVRAFNFAWLRRT